MVLSVFVVDVFFRFLYVHILKKEKNELFGPCQGYSSGSLWLGRCLVIDFCRSTGVDGSGVVSAI